MCQCDELLQAVKDMHNDVILMLNHAETTKQFVASIEGQLAPALESLKPMLAMMGVKM